MAATGWMGHFASQMPQPTRLPLVHERAVSSPMSVPKCNQICISCYYMLSSLSPRSPHIHLTLYAKVIQLYKKCIRRRNPCLRHCSRLPPG